MNNFETKNISLPIINIISKIAINNNIKTFLVGGFVRDIF